MEATYYRELTEECASIHGWEDEEKDGEAACWMYREILRLGGQNKDLQAMHDFWQRQDTYRLKCSAVLALSFLAVGLFVGSYWL